MKARLIVGLCVALSACDPGTTTIIVTTGGAVECAGGAAGHGGVAGAGGEPGPGGGGGVGAQGGAGGAGGAGGGPICPNPSCLLTPACTPDMPGVDFKPCGAPCGVAGEYCDGAGRCCEAP